MQPGLSLVAGSILILSWLLATAVQWLRVERRRRSHRQLHGLKNPKKIPLWDPFFGTDLNFTILKQITSCTLLEGLENRFEKHGMTHAFPLGTTSIIATCDPENIKTINTDAKTFPVGEVRRQGMSILHGRGIFAVEGAEWQQSLAALRPAFAKGQHDDVHVLEDHFQVFLERLHVQNYCVDMQDAYHRLTLDTAMQFFFGTPPQNDSDSSQINQFLQSIDYVNETVYMRLVFGATSPQALWRLWQTKRAMSYIHKFVETHVHQVLSSKHTSERYIFLEELSKTVKDPSLLRDQVLTSMLGGKDTTASLLSHITFELARKPHIWKRLQAGISELTPGHCDMKALRSLDYLRYCLLEGLRLYTIVPINMRCASEDAILPVGGGRNGDEPIQVPKDTVLWTGFYSMHRRKDIWGDDAHEYNPDRWISLEPESTFFPFGLGPRTCLGQQFAMNEATFILARMVQTFDRIEATNDNPWKERLAITLGLANGCKVKLHKCVSGNV